MRAAAIVLSRCWPQRKGGRVRFDLPPLRDVADLPRAIAAILQSIADGTLSPEEGAAIAAVVDQQRQAIELIEIERRFPLGRRPAQITLSYADRPRSC